MASYSASHYCINGARIEELVRKILNEELVDGISSLNAALSRRCSSGTPEHDWEQAGNEVIAELEAAVDERCCSVGAVAERLLQVPKDMVLRQDRLQLAYPNASRQLDELMSEAGKLRLELDEALQVRRVLEQQIADQESTNDRLKEQLSGLDRLFWQDGVASLADAVKDVVVGSSDVALD